MTTPLPGTQVGIDPRIAGGAAIVIACNDNAIVSLSAFEWGDVQVTYTVKRDWHSVLRTCDYVLEPREG